jgi:hypothetical protein
MNEFFESLSLISKSSSLSYNLTIITLCYFCKQFFLFGKMETAKIFNPKEIGIKKRGVQLRLVFIFCSKVQIKVTKPSEKICS